MIESTLSLEGMKTETEKPLSKLLDGKAKHTIYYTLCGMKKRNQQPTLLPARMET